MKIETIERRCAAAVLTAMLCGACASDWRDGVSEEGGPQDVAIEFGTTAAASHAQTRADGTLVNINETWLPQSDLTLDASGQPKGPFVGLFGYYTGASDWSNTATADIFYNTRMSIELPTIANGTGGTGYYNNLSYADKRYWPNDQGKMSFWAYYPWNATGDPGDYGVAIVKNNPDDEGDWGVSKGNGMGKIRFRMDEDALKQNDFLVSELKANLTKDGYKLASDGIPNRVSLRFRHMLSQVRLYAFIRGLDDVTYKSEVATQGDLDTAMKKYFRKADETDDGVAAGKWLAPGFVINGVTIDDAYITAHGEELPAVMDEFGTWVELKLGDRVPDETKSVRWHREDGTWDVTHSRRRAAITYSMSINNIRTTAIFTPQYSDGATTFSYENGSELGRATVTHYIMNPYWFRFQDGVRTQLNTEYMYGFFEDTYGSKGSSADAATKEKDGSGMDWSLYNNGQGNAMGYDLTEEFSHGDKHYNYAPCNIIMAVPQVMNDDNVPSISIIARGMTSEGGVPKEMSSIVTINMIGQGLKWESGFIYSYAFLEDNLKPGVDIVRGPESITTFFDPTEWTDQW